MIKPAAITPATRTDPRSRSTKIPGPAKAPRAPANFQSPAPRLRSSTKGSSNARPTAAPSKETRSPAHRFKTVLAVIPITSPGTVSQFGMRRLFKSVHPAMSDKSTAPERITGFKRAPSFADRGLGLPRLHHDIEFDRVNNPFFDGLEVAGAEGNRLPPSAPFSMQKRPLARILT